MYLRGIQLENYRRFESSQTEFPDGIVGILGNNGVGKSTLVEALAWALYGNEASRTGKDEIKRITARPSDVCRVILDFQIQGDNFRVVRQLKGKSNTADASVIVNNKICARGTSAVTDFVAKSLGMDYRAFITSFYAPQKELNILSDFQPYRRKELLARMLGIENIDFALKNLRADKREIEIKTELMELHLKDKDKLALEKRERELRVENLESEIIEKRANFAELKEEFEKFKNKVKELREKFEEYNFLEKKLTEKRTEKKGLLSQLENNEDERKRLLSLSDEKESLKPKVSFYKKTKKTLEELEEKRVKAEREKMTEEQILNLGKSIKVFENRLKELDLKLKEGENIPNRLNRLKDELDQTEKDLEDTRKTYVYFQTSYKSLSTESEKLKKQLENIEELGPDSVCDRCLRPMGDDYEKIRSHLLNEQNQIDEKLNSLKEKKEKKEISGIKLKEKRVEIEKEKEKIQKILEEFLKLKGEKKSLEKSLTEKQKDLTSLEEALKRKGFVEYDNILHQNLKKEFEELEKIKERYTRIEQEAKKLPELEEKIRDLRKKVENFEREEKELNDKIEGLCFSEDEFKENQKELEQKKESLHQLELCLKDILHQKEMSLKEVERLEKEIERAKEIEKEKRDLSKERLYLEKLDLIFSDFKVSLIDRIKPTLSSYAKELFVELTDGRYLDFELDEDYEIFIYDQGERFSVERFSGGEKDLANLCLRLAISLMISESSGVDFSFIILDEIFGSQDQSRKENILNGLARLKNRFRQIFLITHIDDIKDSVENLILVTENEDGTSQLVLQ